MLRQKLNLPDKMEIAYAFQKNLEDLKNARYFQHSMKPIKQYLFFLLSMEEKIHVYLVSPAVISSLKFIICS